MQEPTQRAANAPDAGQMLSNLPQSIAIMVLVYLFLTNALVMKDHEPVVLGPGGQPVAATDPTTLGADSQGNLRKIDLSQGVGPHANVWKQGNRFDMKLFLSPSQGSLSGEELRTAEPDWQLKDLVYGDWDLDRTTHFDLTVTEELYNNGSLYAHFYLCRSGSKWPASALNSESTACATRITALVLYQAPPKKVERKILLADDARPEKAGDAAAVEESREWISYWKPNVTLAVIYDETQYARGKIPPQYSSQMRFTQRGNYFPPLFINDFWLFKEAINPLKD